MKRYLRHRQILNYPIWKPKRSKINYPIYKKFDDYRNSIWFHQCFPIIFSNFWKKSIVYHA